MLSTWKRISRGVGLAACAALGLTGSAGAQTAATSAPNPNQTTANAVANALRSSGALSGYRIEIETSAGIVTLSGRVGTAAQKADAIAVVQRVDGVSGVVDQLSVGRDRAMRRTQYQQVAMGGRHGMFAGGGMMSSETTMAPGMTAGQPAGVANDGGPVPEGPAGMPGATQAAVPSYPNYSWPSYAPHPNFSAVGYPTAYPWQAWPNIAAPYPYPEVPLDWRAVTLRWDDGIWWLDFKKHYTRPFFTPYPFGIFAY